MAKFRIAPHTRGGTYTIDKALDVRLLDEAKGYSRVSPGLYRLVYEGGYEGKALITCYDFELVTLGLDRVC